MRYRFSDRPMFVLGDVHPDRPRVYLPPKKGDTYGEHAGDLQQEFQGDGWQIASLALHDYDQTDIQRIVFDSKEDAAAFVAMTYKQIKAARDASPVPEDIRAFIENAGRDLQDEERAVRSALLNFTHKARWLASLAEKYGIQNVYLRVDSDPAKMVRRVMEWKRDGDEHPFFTEATLYELVGKDDARSLLGLIEDITSEVDPIEAVDPQRRETEE